jgi:hypothetical protein
MRKRTPQEIVDFFDLPVMVLQPFDVKYLEDIFGYCSLPEKLVDFDGYEAGEFFYPMKECPYCHGMPSKDGCEVCHGTGKVGRLND